MCACLWRYLETSIVFQIIPPSLSRPRKADRENKPSVLTPSEQLRQVDDGEQPGAYDGTSAAAFQRAAHTSFGRGQRRLGRATPFTANLLIRSL